jgi:hypothetical protein
MNGALNRAVELANRRSDQREAHARADRRTVYRGDHGEPELPMPGPGSVTSTASPELTAIPIPPLRSPRCRLHASRP